MGGGGSDYELQQLEVFILLCHGNSRMKKDTQEAEKNTHEGYTYDQKRRISTLKRSKEDETKDVRDNRGHRSIRVNTLLQIRLLLARCTLSLAFVVTARALIHHCVDSTIVVDPIQTLCNPTQSIYTPSKVKDAESTMSERLRALRGL